MDKPTATDDVEARVTAAVAAILAQSGRALPGPAAPLDLDSLAVVSLVDALEEALPLRLHPRDVTAANFATLESLGRLCRSRLAAP